MNRWAVYHVLDTPYSYAKDKDTLVVRIRVAKGDVNKCFVLYKCRYDWDNEFLKKEMAIVAETDLFTYYETEISVVKNRYRYYFELVDNDNIVYHYFERGFVKEDYEHKAMISFQFPYIAEEDLYKEEKWLQESVVYQIFPDRFNNGNKEIDPDNVMEWGKGKITYRSKFGGDLRGIIEKLDYIKELGVDLIYLTPIFKSGTNHKYNTEDYFDIDPQFGTLDDAKELVKKVHSLGMRIILDAVFNHSGHDFFAFKDILENQQQSKYKDWYFLNEFPVEFDKGNYYTFADKCKNMPKLNTNNNEVREYLLNVGEFWIKEIGIDGWRLDVCDEVGHDFWRDFRKRVKAAKSDAVIIGEIMHEANSFLKGDQLDSIMNYPFKNSSIDFFAKNLITAREYLDILATNRILYMDSVTRQMWNLVGSHDTKRVLTECDEDINRVKLIMAMQFTYVGVPYIYYGDEIGIDGGDDPQNRKCMIWDEKKQNRELLDLSKKLISLRRENKALIYGDFIELYCKDNVISFERNFEDNKIIIVLNNNDHTSTVKNLIDKVAKDLFNNIEMEQGDLMLEPYGFKILQV